MGPQAEEVMTIVGMEGKSLNNPDEVRTFDKGKLELVNIGGKTVGYVGLCEGVREKEKLNPHRNLVKIRSQRKGLRQDRQEGHVAPG